MAFVFKYLKGHVLQVISQLDNAILKLFYRMNSEYAITIAHLVFQLAVTFVTGCAGPILGMFLAGFIFPSINAIVSALSRTNHQSLQE